MKASEAREISNKNSKIVKESKILLNDILESIKDCCENGETQYTTNFLEMSKNIGYIDPNAYLYDLLKDGKKWLRTTLLLNKLGYRTDLFAINETDYGSGSYGEDEYIHGIKLRISW